jgi:hypothetical protein
MEAIMAIPHEIRPPPTGCRVIVEEHPGGFTITIPPHGLVRGGGGGLVLFILLWVSCTIFITACSFDHAPTSGGVPSPPARYLGPLLFWASSTGLFLLMISLGRRRALLSVFGDRLEVEEIRPFLRTKRGSWERGQLFAICAGPTRGDFRQLEIFPQGEPPFTLLYTGPAMELEWLSGVLRQRLRLDAEPRDPGVTRESVVSSPAPSDSLPDSERPNVGYWIASAFLGAVCVTIFWNIFNSGGFLARLGLPWSSVFLCAAGGAMIGIGGVALQTAYRRRRVRRLAEASLSMNLALQREVSREDLGPFFYLRLFRRWSSAKNRMTGIVDGIPVDMLDYTFEIQYGKGASHYRQTVLLLPAPENGVPPFDLRPRGYFDMFFIHQGFPDYKGITIKPDKGQPRRVRECLERFRLYYELRRYYLSDHFEQAAAWARLKGRPADNGLDADRPGTEEDIRRFFNLELLHFFADHPGWRIESDGIRLALWHPNKTIRAARRPRFIAEALELYRALARAGTMAESQSTHAIQVTGDSPGVDRAVSN